MFKVKAFSPKVIFISNLFIRSLIILYNTTEGPRWYKTKVFVQLYNLPVNTEVLSLFPALFTI